MANPIVQIVPTINKEFIQISIPSYGEVVDVSGTGITPDANTQLSIIKNGIICLQSYGATCLTDFAIYETEEIQDVFDDIDSTRTVEFEFILEGIDGNQFYIEYF